MSNGGHRVNIRDLNTTPLTTTLSVPERGGTIAVLSQIINETSNSRTLFRDDDNDIIVFDNSSVSTLTIPENTAVPIPVGSQIQVINKGSANVSFVASTGVTVLNGIGNLLSNQRAFLTKTETNEWLISF